MKKHPRRQDRLAAIGRMAASIAHEIRNPLAAMRGSIQMLHAEMDSDTSQAQLMEIILRESDRLNRIITDFLSYARPRSLIQARVDVGDLLHQTFALMRHSPEINPNQSIVEELSDEPIFAEADEGQLKQVFWNLARNALQAMPQGGTLRATLEKNSNNRLRISFADYRARHVARSGRTSFRAILIDHRRDGSGTLNCLSNHSRSWWYNQCPQSRGTGNHDYR